MIRAALLAALRARRPSTVVVHRLVLADDGTLRPQRVDLLTLTRNRKARP